MEQRQTGNRVIFLDNLRYMIVLCVVLLHSSQAYQNMHDWWPVSDRTSLIIDPLFVLWNSFTMPLLFYIAGYFAVPVVGKKGTALFIKGKLKRLGIPWLVFILTICPILPFIYHFTRNELTLSTSYRDSWVTLMKNTVDLKIGFMPAMSELVARNLFYQWNVWFLSLLLLFFLIFSLIYHVRRSWFDADPEPVVFKQPSVFSTLKILFGVGITVLLFTGIAVAAIFRFGPEPFDPTTLFTFGNIIQFKPMFFVEYVIYFGLGITTYQKRWIEKGIFPGHLKTWAISFVILLSGYLYFFHIFTRGPIEIKYIGLLAGPVGFFLTVSVLGLTSSFAIKYWNRPTRVNQSLASNSYNIYLSHYIFMPVFQLILFMVPGIPPLLKFGVVAVLTIACSYLVSQFLIKPHPRITVAGLTVLFVVMVLVIRP